MMQLSPLILAIMPTLISLLSPSYYQGKKVTVKLLFQLGVVLKKRQKQGRDERTQEHYPTSAKIHSRCRHSSCTLSSLPCFCPFSGPSLTKMKFYRNLPPQFVFFLGVSKQPSKQKTKVFIVLETNTFGTGNNTFGAVDERVQHQRRLLQCWRHTC